MGQASRRLKTSQMVSHLENQLEKKQAAEERLEEASLKAQRGKGKGK